MKRINKKVTADEQQVASLLDAGLDAHQIALVMNAPQANINQMVADIKQRRNQTIQQLLKINFGRPLELKGDDWMITADWHVPETDWRLTERMIGIAQKHMLAPRRLIIAGDFFSQTQFSKYAHLIPPTPWAQERDAAREILRCVLDTFAEVYIVMGNHDRRLVKWADAALDETDLFGMVVNDPRVVVSKFAYLTLNASTGKWRVTHPEAYRQVRGSAAAVLADDLGMNVISGHEHHTALLFSKSGRHLVVNIGGLYDPGKIAYTQLTDNLKPRMKPSFAMLKDGYINLFADGLSPWSVWGV